MIYIIMYYLIIIFIIFIIYLFYTKTKVNESFIDSCARKKNSCTECSEDLPCSECNKKSNIPDTSSCSAPAPAPAPCSVPTSCSAPAPAPAPAPVPAPVPATAPVPLTMPPPPPPPPPPPIAPNQSPSPGNIPESGTGSSLSMAHCKKRPPKENPPSCPIDCEFDPVAYEGPCTNGYKLSYNVITQKKAFGGDDCPGENVTTKDGLEVANFKKTECTPPPPVPIDCEFDPVAYEGPCINGHKLSYNVITQKKAFGGNDCPGENVVTKDGLDVANFKKTECTPPPPAPIDCEVGNIISGNCNNEGKKPQGKIILTEASFGGKECAGKQIINDKPVADWEMVDCDDCGDNMKRDIDGVCVNTPINCEIGDLIFGNCDQQGKKAKGYIIKTEPRFNGTLCPEKVDTINNKKVAKWELIDCEPCNNGKMRNAEGNCVDIVCQQNEILDGNKCIPKPIDCKISPIIDKLDLCNDPKVNKIYEFKNIITRPEENGKECPEITKLPNGKEVVNVKTVECPLIPPPPPPPPAPIITNNKKYYSTQNPSICLEMVITHKENENKGTLEIKGVDNRTGGIGKITGKYVNDDIVLNTDMNINLIGIDGFKVAKFFNDKKEFRSDDNKSTFLEGCHEIDNKKYEYHMIKPNGHSVCIYLDVKSYNSQGIIEARCEGNELKWDPPLQTGRFKGNTISFPKLGIISDGVVLGEDIIFKNGQKWRKQCLKIVPKPPQPKQLPSYKKLYIYKIPTPGAGGGAKYKCFSIVFNKNEKGNGSIKISSLNNIWSGEQDGTIKEHKNISGFNLNINGKTFREAIIADNGEGDIVFTNGIKWVKSNECPEDVPQKATLRSTKTYCQKIGNNKIIEFKVLVYYNSSGNGYITLEGTNNNLLNWNPPIQKGKIANKNIISDLKFSVDNKRFEKGHIQNGLIQFSNGEKWTEGVCPQPQDCQYSDAKTIKLCGPNQEGFIYTYKTITQKPANNGQECSPTKRLNGMDVIIKEKEPCPKAQDCQYSDAKTLKLCSPNQEGNIYTYKTITQKPKNNGQACSPTTRLSNGMNVIVKSKKPCPKPKDCQYSSEKTISLCKDNPGFVYTYKDIIGQPKNNGQKCSPTTRLTNGMNVVIEKKVACPKSRCGNKVLNEAQCKQFASKNFGKKLDVGGGEPIKIKNYQSKEEIIDYPIGCYMYIDRNQANLNGSIYYNLGKDGDSGTKAEQNNKALSICSDTKPISPKSRCGSKVLNEGQCKQFASNHLGKELDVGGGKLVNIKNYQHKEEVVDYPIGCYMYLEPRDPNLNGAIYYNLGKDGDSGTKAEQDGGAYSICSDTKPKPLAPVNCEMGPWTPWSDCQAKKCGETGIKTRTRVFKQKPLNGGKCNDLNGITEQEISCRAPDCDKNCVMGNWSGWSACKGQCGQLGTRTKTRQIREGSMGNGTCNEPRIKTENCQMPVCNVDCKLSNWTPWSDCQGGQCGGRGTQTRTRHITQPSTGNGTCNQPREEKRNCTMKECPVNCKYGPWGLFGSCTGGPCNGRGTQTSTRQVIQQATGGGSCNEPTTKKQSCLMPMCPPPPPPPPPPPVRCSNDETKINGSCVDCRSATIHGCNTAQIRRDCTPGGWCNKPRTCDKSTFTYIDVRDNRQKTENCWNDHTHINNTFNCIDCCRSPFKEENHGKNSLNKCWDSQGSEPQYGYGHPQLGSAFYQCCKKYLPTISETEKWKYNR